MKRAETIKNWRKLDHFKVNVLTCHKYCSWGSQKIITYMKSNAVSPESSPKSDRSLACPPSKKNSWIETD